MTINRKRIGVWLAILIGLIIVLVLLIVLKPAPPDIGLVYFVRHPAIDEGIRGFDAGLDSVQKIFHVKLTIEKQDAHGEIREIHSIVARFLERKTKIVVALTTPCAQVADQLAGETPVVFVGVSDPVGSGLVNSLDFGKGNITGTTSKVPNFQTLELAKRLLPNLSKIGIIYTATESNSIAIIEMLERDIRNTNIGLSIQKRAVMNPMDIYPTVRALLAETDALFIINDNTIVSSVQLVLRAAEEANKPVLASDRSTIEQGAAFGYILDYRDEGIAASKIVAEILLEGKKPEEIPIAINQVGHLYINPTVLKRFAIDSSLIKGATCVP